MAIQANQPGIEEEKDKENAAIGAPAPSLGGGTAPGAGGVGSAAAQTPGAIGGGDKPATSSGSFTDVGKYLKANKPGIQKYASGIAGKVAGQVGEASQAVENEATGIQSEIESSKLPGSNFYQDKDVSNLNVGESQKLLSGGWGGPSVEEAALSRLTDLGKARDLANLSSSYSGSKQLIGEAVRPESGRYSRGMTSLGAASLQGDQGARQTLSDVRDQAGAAYEAGLASQDSLREQVGAGIESNKAAGGDFLKWLQGQEANTLQSAKDMESQRAQSLQTRLGEEEGTVDQIMRAQNSQALIDSLGGENYLRSQANLWDLLKTKGVGEVTTMPKLSQEEVQQGLGALSKRTSAFDTLRGSFGRDISGLQSNIPADKNAILNAATSAANFGGLSAQQIGQANALAAIGGGQYGLGESLKGISQYDARAQEKAALQELFNKYFT